MAVLPVEFEILIPLLIAILFTLLYEFDRKNMLWSGVVAMGVWLVSGMVFLIVSSYPVIAYVFLVVGIIYVIRILIAQFDPLRAADSSSRRLEGDTD